MNDCPACGLEFNRRERGGRSPSTEVPAGSKVCARAEYDEHNYAYAVIYVHEPVDETPAPKSTDTDQ